MYLFIYDIYPTSDRWAWIFTYVVHPWSGHLHSHRCFLLSLSVVCVGYSALTPENIVLQCQRETYDKCLVVTQWQFGNHCQRLFGVGGLVVFYLVVGFTWFIWLVWLFFCIWHVDSQPTKTQTKIMSQVQWSIGRSISMWKKIKHWQQKSLM